MRVSKWKVLGIAGALVLSYAVTSDAAQIKVSDETFADLGYWMKVRYNYVDERQKEGGIDWNMNVFDVVDARFNIEGQITKVFQFYGEVVTGGAYGAGVYDVLKYPPLKGRDTNAKLSEGGINLVFVPEFQVRLGKIRIPFTRDQQEARYSYIIQSDWFYDPQGIINMADVIEKDVKTGDYFIDPSTGEKLNVMRTIKYRQGPPIFGGPGAPDPILRLFDGGVNVHGEIAGGILRYDIGAFNEPDSDQPLQDVSWAVRLEFSPPILGFKPETKTTGRGWLHDTRLGRAGDVLTIGVAYYSQDYESNILSGHQIPKDLDIDAYTVDVFMEKKFGPVLLNLEGAYIYIDDSHLSPDGDKEDTYLWYIQGQLLYDCVVGIGKPAIYVKYEYAEKDKVFAEYDDFEFNRLAIGINYYVKGNAARLTAGMDYVWYDDGAEDWLKNSKLEDDITDFYVQAQIMF